MPYSQWIGYVDPEEDKNYYIMIESEITTRAKLGHVASILVSKFMMVRFYT